MKSETKTKILKTSLILLIIALIVLAIYLPLKLSGVLDEISSVEHLKEIILNGEMYSYLIFFIIQFLQVTLLPIPALVTTMAGTYVFGPWLTFLISFVSVMLASLFSFFLGRKIGRKLVVWIVGEQDTLKWQKKLERGKYAFFLMMLFPIFPDDILCLIVGATTNISYKFFIITNLITRPIAIGCTCFLGSGQIIPFSGWGIPVWIAIVLLGLIALILSFKYQPQIENFMLKLVDKLHKNDNENNTNQTEQNLQDCNLNDTSVNVSPKLNDNQTTTENNLNNNTKSDNI